MSKLNVKDLVFREDVHDPHNDTTNPSVRRLMAPGPGSNRPVFEVDELWGFLRIKGKRRVVLVGKDNVASMLLDDEPVAVDAKGKK